MNAKKSRQLRVSASLLFQAWRDAAAEWRRLKSDPAETKCRAARRDYYLSAWGEVPALPALATPETEKVSVRASWSDLSARELAKALLRADSARSLIADPSVPLMEVVKAIRRGGSGAGGGWPDRNYEVQVEGLHVDVRYSQNVLHSPPIRFTSAELVKELRIEAAETAETQAPIAVGDRVRICEASQAAYHHTYWGKVGVAESVNVTRSTKVRRWLVAYEAYGRYQVREEHLERIAIAAEAGEQVAS